MNRKFLAGVASAAAALPAFAGSVTNIDGLVVNARVFNDFPASTLVIVNNYPALASITDGPFNSSGGGFANRHDLVLADGGSPFLLQTSDGFDLSVTTTLDAGSLAPRKEAGIRFNSNIGGDGLFILASDNGESAAFGGALPFFGFGAGAYTPGTAVTMRVIYTPDDDGVATPGDASTIEYILGATSSGPIEFSNLENGFINGTQIALYGQFSPNQSNTSDFGFVSFENISIVPEPASLALLALGLGALLRGRRN